MEMTKTQIIESLQPFFKKARTEKLLFRSNYQGILFTPDELETKQKNGQFIWGLPNWELINPVDEYNDLSNRAKNFYKIAEEFKIKHLL